MANALIKRCQSTALIVTAAPKGSKGILERGERANLKIEGQLRAFRETVSMKYKTAVGPDHVLMGWMVRHCAWVVNNVQVKGIGTTPHRSIWGKDYTREVVPFGEVCLGRNHSEDGAKLNMRWLRGVFVSKLDRTDEFLLLTPTGAMKTRCVRRLEGDMAVRGMPQQRARSRHQQSNKRRSWKAADVRKECTCDRTFWTNADVLQDSQVVLESGSTHRRVPSKN